MLAWLKRWLLPSSNGVEVSDPIAEARKELERVATEFRRKVRDRKTVRKIKEALR